MFKPVYETLSDCVLEAYPELQDETSATDASKILFGVKTMTRLIHLNLDTILSIRDLFQENHSDMVEFAKYFCDMTYMGQHRFSEHVWTNISLQTYKHLTSLFGVRTTVSLFCSRDFNDTVSGLRFIQEDKKRNLKFKAFLPSLNVFPAAIHATMIHDYCDNEMKKQEKRYSKKAETIPYPEHSCVPREIGKYKILLPSGASDLKRIGDAQHHCVGTTGMGYGKRVRKGECIIFALYRENLADGVCIELNPYLDILQAQGRFRREPTEKENAVIEQVRKYLGKV